MKTTKEIFIKKLESIHPNQFKLIGEFISLTTKTKFKCKCGNEFETVPEYLYNKKRIGCPNCCYKNRKVYNEVTKEVFIEKLNKFYPNNDYKLLDEYIDYETPIQFKHKCGNVIKIIPHTLVGSSAPFKYCIYCNPVKNRSYSYNEIKNLIEKDNEYKLISKEYKTNKDKLEIQHNKCQGIFKMSFNRFQCGDRCPICAGHQRFSKEDFERIFYKNNKDYKIISEYKSLSKPLKIKHLKCNNDFEINEARQAIPSCKCKICYEQGSKNEILIKKWFDDNNIKYEREKKFDECKNKYLLPFDFYLPEYKLLIEFDGEQHFKKLSFNKSEKEFSDQQKRDNIKNEWVKKSKEYSLIRINYKQDPIELLEDILIKEKDLDDLNVFYILND